MIINVKYMRIKMSALSEKLTSKESKLAPIESKLGTEESKLSAEESKSILKESTCIDVVMPCHEKDIFTLEFAISGIKKHCKNIRRVIIVSSKPLSKNAEWFDEKKFPFTKHGLCTEIFNDTKESKKTELRSQSLIADSELRSQSRIADFENHPQTRIGWIYQQFLKLYAPIVIPDISPNVLILDTDVIFVKDVQFIDENGKALFDTGTEYHPPYFVHAEKLLQSPNKITKLFPYLSGICGYMLFQKHIIQKLFDLISESHKIEVWKALCRQIDRKQIMGSCMSEYEIYFNFAFKNFSDQVKIRPLKRVIQSFSYKDINESNDKKNERIESLLKLVNSDYYDVILCQTWIS